MYEDYSVVLIGKSDMGVADRRLKLSGSLKDARDKGLVTGEIIIFSTLECYPDERFLFSAGRILSLPEIGSAGGYVIPRPDRTLFENFSFSVLSSFFLNLNLTYRYKPLNFMEVGELQLNGLFIKRECLDMEALADNPRARLEHILGSQVRNSGMKITYSPDIILYKRFPMNPGEMIEFVGKSAEQRARQRTKPGNNLMLSLALIFFISAFILAPVIFHNILFAAPVILYYIFMLFCRVLFYGFIEGPVSFLYLACLQVVYGVKFLTGLFEK
jgi:hypothetical protein